MNDPDAAAEYHRLTVHSPGRSRLADDKLVSGYVPMRPERKPAPFKWYPHPGEPLPDPVDTGIDAVAALSGTASAQLQLDTALVSRLLFSSAGVVRSVDTAAFGTMYFRAAGSAGNLHPLEVYLVARSIGALDDGVYHYEPLEHALTRVAPAPRGGPAALVVTGVPWRTAWKYTERGFRHLYWDCGTMLAHLLLVAEAAGLHPRVLMGFVDTEVTRLVGADGATEVPLAVVALGAGEPGLTPVEDALAGRLAPDPVDFPLIGMVQHAGDLPDSSAVDAWRMERPPAESAVAPLAHPAAPAPAAALETVILRRGSTRRFRSDVESPPALLYWAMAAATRPVDADFLEPGTTLLSHRLIVHSVAGVEPGAYVWLGGGASLEPVRAGELRPEARYLCLGQELGGDGAYTAFHCSDLELLRFLGARGYRAMQLEAGIAEGRLHLAAYALGHGATGLTFFDDEVSRFFASRASPMLVTAVGPAAYRSRAGGAPRHPTVLRS